MAQDIRLTKLIMETSYCKLIGKFLFEKMTMNKSTSSFFSYKIGQVLISLRYEKR
jgi:hypothetical protein